MGVLDHEGSFSQAVSRSDNSARLKTLCVEVEYIKQVSNQRGQCPFDKLVSHVSREPDSEVFWSSSHGKQAVHDAEVLIISCCGVTVSVNLCCITDHPHVFVDWNSDHWLAHDSISWPLGLDSHRQFCWSDSGLLMWLWSAHEWAEGLGPISTCFIFWEASSSLPT